MIKKITFIGVMAMLYLNFIATAQDNKAVDVTLKGIQIGQKMPDVTLTSLHNYRDANGKAATTAKLSDFKGRLLILDFWATWCSPCVAMIPKMDSLQKAFGDKIQFLSVTYQTEKEVLPFLQKFEKQRGEHYDLPVVTADKELHQLFPHVYLPHYVWIDGSGVVRAFTEYKDVNMGNIEKMLQGTGQFTQKRDKYRPYDFKETLQRNLQNSDWNAVYCSTLTPYIDGVSGGFNITDTDPRLGKRVTLTNTPLIWLYKIAFWDKGYLGKNRIKIETVDSSRFDSKLSGDMYLQWLKSDNGFCYELKVPAKFSSNIYDRMRDDISYMFPKYKARMEKRDAEVYALKRTSSIDKIRSTGNNQELSGSLNGYKLHNTYLSQLINQLNMVYQQNSPFPIIDLTGYNEKVDIDIPANLSDMVAINKVLSKYDLKFVRIREPIEILVISDAQAQPESTILN